MFLSPPTLSSAAAPQYSPLLPDPVAVAAALRRTPFAGEVVRIAGSSKESAVVTFQREGPRITIAGDGVDVHLTAIVGINANGDCRYFIGEGEFLGWEVRKQSLDQLFFGDSEDE